MKLKDDRVHPPRWISIRDIEGAVAMWAVRQSPYMCPDKLDVVLAALDQKLRQGVEVPGVGNFVSKFDFAGFASLTPDLCLRVVDLSLKSIPEFREWNRTRNAILGVKPDPQFVFVSRYGGPSPDDDFIDLDALIRNVVNTVFREADEEYESAEAFERRWSSPIERLSRFWHFTVLGHFCGSAVESESSAEP